MLSSITLIILGMVYLYVVFHTSNLP